MSHYIIFSRKNAQVMKTLHIFTGAPKILSYDDNVSEVSGNIWKRYTYTTEELWQRVNMFSEDDFSEIFLQYEVNQSQLSNLVESSCNNTMRNEKNLDNVGEWDDVDFSVDKVYREVCIESQFLLFNSEDCFKRSIVTLPRYCDLSQTCLVDGRNGKQDCGTDPQIEVLCQSHNFNTNVVSDKTLTVLSESEKTKNNTFPLDVIDKNHDTNKIGNHCNGENMAVMVNTEPIVIAETQEQNGDDLSQKSVHTPIAAACNSTKDINDAVASKTECNCGPILKGTGLGFMVSSQSHCSTCTIDRDTSSTDSHVPLNTTQTKITTTSIEIARMTKQVSNFLVIVLQSGPIKMFEVKRGANMGQKIQLSTIMVGDESDFYFNITLWNDCANWVDRIRIGDVVLVTNISMQLYRGKHVGQSNTSSQIYNFRRPVWPFPESWSDIVCSTKLRSFLAWIQNKHAYLHCNSLKIKTDIVQHIFRYLNVGHINNICARLVSVSTPGKQEKYSFMGSTMMKVIVKLEDKEGSVLELFLWGEKHHWITEFHSLINSILVIHTLLCKYDSYQNNYNLHTTFKSHYYVTTDWKSNDMILHCLCKIKSIYVTTKRGNSICISNSNVSQESPNILSLFYVGCNMCHCELGNDGNSIYSYCKKCDSSEVVLCISRIFMMVQKYQPNERCDEQAVFQKDNNTVIADSFGVWVEAAIGKLIFSDVLKFNPKLFHESNKDIITATMVILKQMFSEETVYHVNLKKIECSDTESSLDSVYSLEKIIKYTQDMETI